MRVNIFLKEKKIIFGSLLVLFVGVLGWTHFSNDITNKQANTDNIQNKQVDSKDSKKDASGSGAVSNTNLNPNSESKPEPIFYPIDRVVDGDTVAVNMSGDAMLVRIIGIDSPEVDSDYTEQECFGAEASAKLKELLTDKTVRMEYDTNQGMLDKYGRLLAYLFLEDGTNVGGYMIDNGYAREYTFDSLYMYQKEFRDAEHVAREQKLGLWAPDACAKQNEIK